MENISANINRETQNANAELTEEACTNLMKILASHWNETDNFRELANWLMDILQSFPKILHG